MDATQRELEAGQQIVEQKVLEVWEAAKQKLKRMWVESKAAKDADRLLQREEESPRRRLEAAISHRGSHRPSP